MIKLSVINEACEGATAGPWTNSGGDYPVPLNANNEMIVHPGEFFDDRLRADRGDVNFIALARTALPAFLLARTALSAYCAGSGDDTPLQVFDKALFDLAEIEASK